MVSFWIEWDASMSCSRLFFFVRWGFSDLTRFRPRESFSWLFPRGRLEDELRNGRVPERMALSCSSSRSPSGLLRAL